MAPNVSVPMNFGIHLLDSPTHSTLELRANNGATVRASSVILSFNSPVIDHMTTTLHLTSLDMEEFSEEAVRYFVHAAYTGETPPISRDMFRDVNKISHVFKVSWLVKRCVEQFSRFADAIVRPSYNNFLFIFEEAAFLVSEVESCQLAEIAFKTIKLFNWKEQFISEYLVNLSSLSHQHLDLIIDLAESDVHFIVKPLTEQLTSMLESKQEVGIPENFKYLIDNGDISCASAQNPDLVEQMFDTLQDLADGLPDDLLWVLKLIRKATKSEKGPESTCPSPPTSAESCGYTLINVPPNLFHTLDCAMDFDTFVNCLGESELVTNLLMFFEGLLTWMYKNREVYIECSMELIEKMEGIRECRAWSPIYGNLLYFKPLDNFPFEFFSSVQNSHNLTMPINSTKIEETSTRYQHSLHSVLVDKIKLQFPYKHPAVKCSIFGKFMNKCGFLLKATPTDANGNVSLTLCTDPADYSGTGIHFHEELRAENIIHLTLRQDIRSTESRLSWGRWKSHYIPISWVGKPQIAENKLLFNFSIPDVDFIQESFNFCALISS